MEDTIILPSAESVNFAIQRQWDLVERLQTQALQHPNQNSLETLNSALMGYNLLVGGVLITEEEC